LTARNEPREPPGERRECPDDDGFDPIAVLPDQPAADREHDREADDGTGRDGELAAHRRRRPEVGQPESRQRDRGEQVQGVDAGDGREPGLVLVVDQPGDEKGADRLAAGLAEGSDVVRERGRGVDEHGRRHPDRTAEHPENGS